MEEKLDSDTRHNEVSAWARHARASNGFGDAFVGMTTSGHSFADLFRSIVVKASAALRGSPPPHGRVIALHSSASSGKQWSSLAARLSDLDFIAPDLYGHGGAPAWQGHAEDLVFADAARIARMAMHDDEPCHLVGHSYGGAIAIAIALKFPKQVASVTVFEPVLFGTLIEQAPSAWSEVYAIARAIESALAQDRPEHAGQVFVDFWSGAGTWELMPAARRASIARCMSTVAAQFMSMSACRGALAGLGRIQAPVLHLASDGAPKAMHTLERLLRNEMPDAEFEIMAGMGHMGPVTHASQVAERIERNLRERLVGVPAVASSVVRARSGANAVREPA